MRRPAFYSRSPRTLPQAADPAADEAAVPSPEGAAGNGAPPPPHAKAGWQPGRRSFAFLLVLCTALVAGGATWWPRQGKALTQKDIDSAVLRTLQTHTLPSPAAKAAEIVRPSVVRVVGYGPEKATPEARIQKRGRNMAKGKPPEADAPPGEVERGVGTGVVIVDKGVILTNLHVVAGAETIKVTFSDGLEAVATITGVQPENDLAVLQAQKIPDDLIPAAMRSTADLQPGDQVAAVGFPFGIGPSVSAGVVSGLKRSFRSPEGKQELGNLIQFDAAANPGNSGGPLINMDGEVLGIVTAILNPTQQRTFIGIGFAVPIENAASAAGSPPF
ncbi:trypsin-like peptidase [Variovorax beijingensis]|uniref:Trypsin-like peptidase n=1 Tax=Variovorax beijingensis TaxID=2496117 RepID=A0A561CCF9_9BURK|nr:MULTISPECIES: trypsin-like peptidase domain-containing protein [Variovorax]MBD9663611.1 trypsin-like peptidase domain-containing protein [Variovorax sp. VRV01]MDP9967372.1 S1-C subfamily serine protease [Variovorax paradoxus]TWD88670.1 trypsin-like peptidase [Variovorax beijingensis]